MRSFTSNMNNHITLQTKGTSIYLAIKESYTCGFQEQKQTQKKRVKFFLQHDKSHTLEKEVYVMQKKNARTKLVKALLYQLTLKVRHVNM